MTISLETQCKSQLCERQWPICSNNNVQDLFGLAGVATPAKDTLVGLLNRVGQFVDLSTHISLGEKDGVFHGCKY